MLDCTHESASGVDRTDLADEAKVWRCDACGWTYRNVETSTANDEFMVRQAVVPCTTCNGTGEIVTGTGHPGFTDVDQCPACSSTGWVER